MAHLPDSLVGGISGSFGLPDGALSVRPSAELSRGRGAEEEEATVATPFHLVIAAAAGRSVCNGGTHGCQIAKFDPFLSLDCAGVEGVGAQSEERKGSNFAA